MSCAHLASAAQLFVSATSCVALLRWRQGKRNRLGRRKTDSCLAAAVWHLWGSLSQCLLVEHVRGGEQRLLLPANGGFSLWRGSFRHPVLRFGLVKTHGKKLTRGGRKWENFSEPPPAQHARTAFRVTLLAVMHRELVSTTGLGGGQFFAGQIQRAILVPLPPRRPWPRGTASVCRSTWQYAALVLRRRHWDHCLS